MNKVKITAAVLDEIVQIEMHTRIDRDPKDIAQAVYKRIYNTPVTRKDGSITIEVNDLELEELYGEASYQGDPKGACDPTAGYIKAWAGLARQIKKLR